MDIARPSPCLWTLAIILLVEMLFPRDARCSELRIVGIVIDATGHVIVSHISDPKCYYILKSGNLSDITKPTASALGRTGIGVLTDLSAGSGSKFFQIEERSIDAPLDLDGDGINDVYELRHSHYLSPLDARDANIDFDGNGKSNIEDFQRTSTLSISRPGAKYEGKIAAGDSHVIAIKSDGTLWAWGKNTYGQLGDGTEISKTFPTLVSSETTWKMVAAGFDHSIGLKSDGSVWIWGGTFTSHNSTPQQIASPLRFSAIWGRSDDFMAVDTAGHAWGYLDLSQSSTSKGFLKFDDTHIWNSLPATSSLLGLRADGSLWEFSGNYDDDGNLFAFPPARLGTGSDWSALLGNGTVKLALNSRGHLFSWGSDSRGRIGDGSISSSRAFETAFDFGSGWTGASAGKWGVNAVGEAGTLWAWGGASRSTNPNDAAENLARATPHQLGTESSWIGTHAGWEYTLAVRSDSSVWAIGANVDLPGQLLLTGDGKADKSSFYNGRSELLAVGEDDDWLQAFAWDSHSLAVKTTGTLWSWGNNSSGQLGVGDFKERLLPTRVGTESDWAAVQARLGTSLGLKKDGTVWAWGNLLDLITENGFTAPGTSDPIFIQRNPVQIATHVWISNDYPPSGDHFVEITNTVTGQAITWGDNSMGQLGASELSASRAKPIYLGPGWSQLRAFQGFTLAEKFGKFYAWGNLLNLLGLRTAIQEPRSQPFPVSINKQFWLPNLPQSSLVKLTVKEDHSLFAEGWNFLGQLGDGTLENRAEAVPIVAQPPSKLFLLDADRGIVLESRDRFLRGRIKISDFTGPSGTAPLVLTVRKRPGDENPSMTFGETESFTYRDLLGEHSSAFIYPDAEEVLSDDDVTKTDKPTNPIDAVRATQAVTFVRKGDLLEFYVLFSDVGAVEVIATQDGISDTFSHTLVPDARSGGLIDSVDEHINAADAPDGSPTTKTGFWHRVLTTKALIPFFDVLQTHASYGLGGIDGFWGGAKGDYEAIVELPHLAAALLKAMRHPIEAAQAAHHLLQSIKALPPGSFSSSITTLWSEYLKGVDSRVEWLGVPASDQERANYTGSYMFGFGTEQTASTLITGGLGKAILAVSEATRVGRFIAQGVSKVRRGINAVRFQLVRFLPRATLTAVLVKLEVELAQPVAVGVRAAEVIVEKFAQFHGPTLDAVAAAAAKYTPDVASATYRRISRVIEELGKEMTDEAMKGIALVSGRVPLLEGDQLFDKFFVVFRGDKKRLAESLANYNDVTSRLDDDFLTLLLVLKKDVDPFVDHPELVRFGDVFDKLKYDTIIENGQIKRVERAAEGLGGARYEERTGETLLRPEASASGGREWDFETQTGFRIELKGPVLENGNFISRVYDSAFALDALVRPTEKVLAKSAKVTDKVVVDTFGFGAEEARVVKEAIAQLPNPHNIVVEIQ